jgi:hypothetical protein
MAFAILAIKVDEMTNISRRTFVSGGVTALALQADDNPAPPSSLTTVDFRKLVSKADLVYEKPVPRSEEGMPIGNGRMGSLVWTTPQQLPFQINRADVYASNSASNSFFERHNDYCGGCSYLDLDFATEKPAFPESGFAQRLSIYDGMLAIDSPEVKAQVFAWPEQDVIAIQVSGRTAPVKATLRMLRYETKYFGGAMGSDDPRSRGHRAARESYSGIAADRRWPAHRADAGVSRGRFLLKVGRRDRDCRTRGHRADRERDGRRAGVGRTRRSLYHPDLVEREFSGE